MTSPRAAGNRSPRESAPVSVSSSEGSGNPELAGRLPCRRVQGLPRATRKRRMEPHRDDPGAHDRAPQQLVCEPGDERPLVTGGGARSTRRSPTPGLTGTPSAGGPPASTRSCRERLPPEPEPDPGLRRLSVSSTSALTPQSPTRTRPSPGSTAAAYWRRGKTFTDGPQPKRCRATRRTSTTTPRPRPRSSTSSTPCTPRVAQGGRCVASATTTCETAPASFAGVVSDVDTGMFQHVMGNDPRPALLPPDLT